MQRSVRRKTRSHRYWISVSRRWISAVTAQEESLLLDTSSRCVAALKECRDARALADGRRIHSTIAKNGLDRDALVGNFIIQMYARCGAAREAKSAFERIANPTSHSWNILLAAFTHNGHLLEAQILYGRMPWPDRVSANIMVTAYGQAGRVDLAEGFFHTIRDKDIVSWNSMLAAYARNDRGHEALDLFREMDVEGFVPNKVSFVSLLQACSSMRDARLAMARMIQDLMAPCGHESNVIAATALLNLYGHCGATAEAKAVFDRIPHPNAVSWTTMLIILARSGDLASASEIFHRMPCRSVVSWNGMIAALVEKDLGEARAVFDSMPAHDIVSMNSMLGVFSQAGALDPMQDLFDRMACHWNFISWTTMIVGYAQAGDLRESLRIFKAMQLQGETINQVAFVAILDACADAAALDEGRKIHALVAAELGLALNVANVLIKLYANGGRLEYARDIFETLARPDVVTATAMITAYGRLGCAHDAQRVFDGIRHQDVITWTALIGAYAQTGDIPRAEEIFVKMPERDQMANNTMLVGYGQNACLNRAKALFNEMEQKNVISWNALISAFTANRDFRDALKMLPLMDLSGEAPNKVTFLAAIDACAMSGTASDARSIHAAAAESGELGGCTELGTTLVNMYGRCGSVLNAHGAFNAIRSKSYISWNALVTAYAQNGHADVAGELTRLMELEGFVSNAVTFLSNLFACSHAGMLEEGWKYFLLMRGDYTIEPLMDHYCCMIDLLGRSGMLADASDLIESMPLEPNTVGWNTFFGANRTHGEGGGSVDSLSHLQPAKDSSLYVLISNMYTN